MAGLFSGGENTFLGSSEFRRSVVIVVSITGGVVIGRQYQAPIEGVAAGIGFAALVNSYMDWRNANPGAQ